MIVDTSALLAILLDEQDSLTYAKALESAEKVRVSAANYLEAAVLIDKHGDAIASRRFDQLLKEAGVEIEPVTETQAKVARAAYRDFGKGAKSRAKLNFGDCFAYALAKEFDEPLLFKGKDFTHTDVESAV